MATAIEHFQQQFLDEDVNYHDKLKAFEQVIPTTFQQFEESELYACLRTILCTEQQQLFMRMLNIVAQLPYSQTYYRRSYRAPFSMNIHASRIFNLLLAIQQEHRDNIYEVFASSGREEYINGQMMYMNDDSVPIMSTALFPYIIAERLNNKEAQLEEIIRDILWKNGAHPHYSRELVRGIFMSQHTEMHQLVANVLIAAKNQEGVRQTITESIDEGTLMAQLTMMNVIIEHQLLRFSSVARAVDVWFGLGYEATDVRQLTYVVHTSYEALQHEEKIDALLASDSSLDVFIAIWCIGTQNVEHTWHHLDALFERAPHIQQTAIYACSHMDVPHAYYEAVRGHLLQTTNFHTFIYGFHLVVPHFPYVYYAYHNDAQKDMQQFFDEHPWLTQAAEKWLAKVEQFIEAEKEEVVHIDRKPFPFLSYTFHMLELFKLQILLAAYLQQTDKLIDIAANLKQKPIQYREYFYAYIPAYLERYDLLLLALKDRGTGVRLQAIRKLKAVRYPLQHFVDIVPSLLTLKSGELRMAVIDLLLAQPAAQIEALAETLLTHKKEQVRLGMIEVLVQMKEQLTKDWTTVITTPTANEAKLLKQLEVAEHTFLDTPPDPIAYVLPLQQTASFTFHDFVAYDFKRLQEKLRPLRQLMEAHANHCYEYETYNEEWQTTVIGEYLTADAKKVETIGSIDHLPLAELWVDWLVASDLTALDICCYLYAKKITDGYFRNVLTKAGQAFLQSYVSPEQFAMMMQLNDELYEEQLHTVMNYTVAAGRAPLQQKLNKHASTLSLDYVQFCSSMLLHFAEQEMPHKLTESALTYRDRHYEHYDIYFFGAAFFEMGAYAKSPQQVQQLFHTLQQFYDELDDVLHYVNFRSLLIAFDMNIITAHYLLHALLSSNFQYVLMQRKDVRQEIERSEKAEQVCSLLQSLKQFIVEQELQRGDLETVVTKAVRSIDKIDSIDDFIRILHALQGETLSRQWSYSVQSRKDSLSALLLKVELQKKDEVEVLQKLASAGFTNERLIEVMLYNSKLIPIISAYIGWEGLEEAAWYFIAHTSESTTEYETAKIMEYSEIAPQDFERGAFDRQWFLRATAQLTPAQFKVVYAAAKYAAAGSNHRRAQLYAQATLGELDEAALKAEISAKRNKDKLRAYSLMPATFEQAKERYLFFQSFLKESRQFGAQRRASEAEAVQMAIHNLAQQVSSGNTTQFRWIMEERRFVELKQYFSPVTIDDIQLQLIQQPNTIELVVEKGTKQLKSVPKKIAKHETVLALLAAKKELLEQTRRIKHQLEQAMCEEVLFDSVIIYMLSSIDALATVLERLLWYQHGQLYYMNAQQFYTLDGVCTQIQGNIQLAHPVHLQQCGQWRKWQHFVFAQQWQQPFKQVFRELYLVTDDERGQVTTNRLEGYQIQPNKAVALLKARGWKVGYEEPLRKISYRYNYITHIDFVNHMYTPAEVEAPTLATIYFEHRLTGEKEKLDHIPAVHFSEIMRDLDLVVSVAHAGEVDPEASHSTVEMRAAIMTELVHLFDLTNVTVQEPHVFIKGQLGHYSIHLGSGHVHQQGGAMIPVMAIPSQHRGRVFLPFLDEDVKTAEISAKLLLFADDAAINDPQIRKAIR